MLKSTINHLLEKKTKTKSVKKSEIITDQAKTFENPNIVDIKSIITEQPKTSHKLSKNVRQAKKVGFSSSLYSDTKKGENFLNEKNVKIKRELAFKDFASTYNVEILNSFNPELQLKDTESAIKSKLIELLTQLEGFKFVTTLVLVFKKIESEDKTRYDNFYLSSKAEIIINESDINYVLQSIYIAIITNIQKSLGKGSGWIIDSVIDHSISISKYNPLAGSSYIKLLKELDHPRKTLINIQNIDDSECFIWCLVRHLNPSDHKPRRITKAGKDFAKRLDFKDINFPVKIRDIHKIEKKNFISISVFGYESKEKYSIYVSKQCCEEKHVDLLLIGEGKKTMFLSTISTDSCMIIHYIAEENIFVVIVYMLSLQKKL